MEQAVCTIEERIATRTAAKILQITGLATDRDGCPWDVYYFRHARHNLLIGSCRYGCDRRCVTQRNRFKLRSYPAAGSALQIRFSVRAASYRESPCTNPGVLVIQYVGNTDFPVHDRAEECRVTRKDRDK